MKDNKQKKQQTLKTESRTHTHTHRQTQSRREAEGESTSVLTKRSKQALTCTEHSVSHTQPHTFTLFFYQKSMPQFSFL